MKYEGSYVLCYFLLELIGPVDGSLRLIKRISDLSIRVLGTISFEFYGWDFP